LNKFYELTRTSKPGFHQRMKRYKYKQEYLSQLDWVVPEIRKDHPGMSLRDLYSIIQPEKLGRDKFEHHFQSLGYGVERKTRKHRTTDSTGVKRFENLLVGKKVTSVNQVWVSDITYYRITDRFYYITFVMDLYSRRIVGYSVSQTLRMLDTSFPALKQGIKLRKGQNLNGLVFHSDGGGQYYSDLFLEQTKALGIKNSMGKTAIENPHAERLNGIIKNNYLRHYDPQSYRQLKSMTAKAVKMYNEQKPHMALGKLSPIQFESLINKNHLINKKKKRSKKRKSDNNINKLYLFNLKTVNTIQA